MKTGSRKRPTAPGELPKARPPAARPRPAEHFVTIHGHFYQPPRENPWLEAVEREDSAWPHHDWNARITTECYGPNAVARILGESGRIVELVNNYARMSFNFGPTLLSWLETERPRVYRAILDADRESRERFGGHGSALAQVYNHMILPLANDRDRRTQVRWGIHDFQHRFGRSPEGMWLPETAVDIPTLEALAEHDIAFTILAPHQAARVRAEGEDEWTDVGGGHVDPTRAYRQRLPSGRSIALFFYDGPISRAIAFEKLLNDSQLLVARLAAAFSAERVGAQLVHVATDGETYGHHHHRGDMALAAALRRLEEAKDVRLTNYAQFLALHSPEHEVEIVERTSWSCAHGVERWRDDCGCAVGGPNGHKPWRKPLRLALDWLRDRTAPRFEQEAGKLFSDPWSARDAYVDVVLDRSEANVASFLERHAAHPLGEPERVEALELLELERHAMLMFTSCGWFFDDLGGIEALQVLRYAGRVVQLAERRLEPGLEAALVERLREAKSRRAEVGDGARIWATSVAPAVVDLFRVAAHWAARVPFEPWSARAKVHGYRVEAESLLEREAGAVRLAVGRAHVTSHVTLERGDVTWGVLHLGDHNLAGGVRPFRDHVDLAALAGRLEAPFREGDLPLLMRRLDEELGETPISLRSLFKDEQRSIVDRVLAEARREAVAIHRQIYERRAPLMRFLAGLGLPAPESLRASAEIALDDELRELVRADHPDLRRVAALVDEAKAGDIALDARVLGHDVESILGRLAEALRSEANESDVVARLTSLVGLVALLRLPVDFWEVQNAVYEVVRSRREQAEGAPNRGLGELVERLGFAVRIVATPRASAG